MSSFQEFAQRCPPTTLLLLTINILVHILIFATSVSVNKFAISGHLVAEGDYYRIVTAAFVHGGIMHIGMNMMSLLQLGPFIERQFGSLQFFMLTLWSIFLTGILYVALAWLFSYVLRDGRQFYQMGVGFSGVLFSYAIIESFHTLETSRSVFGLFSVPARVYPFILLVLLQVLIPGISFIGHLAGVLVGVLTIIGALRCCLPSTEFLQELESSYLSSLTRISGYVHCSDKSLVASFTGSGSSNVCGVLCGGVLYVFAMVWNVVATVLHIVGCPVDRINNFLDSLLLGVTEFWRSLWPRYSDSSEIDSSQINSNRNRPILSGGVLYRDGRGSYQSVRNDVEQPVSSAGTLTPPASINPGGSSTAPVQKKDTANNV